MWKDEMNPNHNKGAESYSSNPAVNMKQKLYRNTVFNKIKLLAVL